MRRHAVRVAIVASLLPGLQGCAAVALTLLSAGIGVAGSAGIDYTMTGTAYRTFTAGHDQLRRAVLTTLRRMAITVKIDASTDEGRRIVAQATDRSVEIELERLTTKATLMRVVVKPGGLLPGSRHGGRDHHQTGQIVDNGTNGTNVTRTAN